MTMAPIVGRQSRRWALRSEQFLVVANSPEEASGFSMGLRTYHGAWYTLDNFQLARVYALDHDGNLHRVRLSRQEHWWLREIEFVGMDRGMTQ